MTARRAVLGLAVACLFCGSVAAQNDKALLAAIERAEDLRLATDPAFSQGLADKSPAVRERTVLAMGRLQDAELARPLADLAFSDPAKNVRQAAIFALGQLGLAEGASPEGEAWKTIYRLLSEPDPDLRVLAVEASGKLAVDGTAEWLIPSLSDPLPRIRTEAAYALFRLRFVPVWRREKEQPPELPEKAREALIAAFADPEPAVRRAAVYAFARFGDPAAAVALLPMLTDGDELTRLFAARALGKSGKPGTAPAFLTRAEEPSAAVRAEVAAALTTLGRVELVPVAWAADPSFHVRAAVARAFGLSSTEESLTALYKLESDTSPTVRSAAIEALAKRRLGAYSQTLEKVLAAPTWTDRAAAARAAASLGINGHELLRRALADRDPRVATAAVEALGTLQGPEIDALLTSALSSTDLAVRGTAVGLVGQRETLARVKLLETAYDTSPGEDWVEVRESIAGALGDLPGGATLLLQRIAGKDPAPSVRSRAAAALAAKGISAALPPSAPAKPSPYLGSRVKKNPVVVMETAKGSLEIECFAAEAPVHCANFVALVKKGFYDGLIWHRVVPSFVVQGGDPRGDGWGGPGYTVRDEIHRRRFEAGTVGMPKGGKDTGGCQLFITHLPTPHLDGNYTVFGRVVRGLEVVGQLEVGDAIVKARLKR